MAIATDEIRRRVRAVFSRSSPVALPSDDTNLIAEGIIDSLALVELLFRIESEFGIVLDLEQVEISDFETIESIARMVARSKASHVTAAGEWR
jgi:methoxymalonate biosynthesis acyl carrier protein